MPYTTMQVTSIPTLTPYLGAPSIPEYLLHCLYYLEQASGRITRATRPDRVYVAVAGT